MGPSNVRETTAKPLAKQGDSRVVTIISGAGVLPLASADAASRLAGANENRWFDRVGFRRQRYANLAAIAVVMGLLWGGVWVVQEFVRLQRLAACYESGTRNCAPLNLERRGR